MIGDFLYQLSARDQASLGVDVYRAKGGASSAATTQTVDFVVPNDRVLILQALSVQLTPGAAQVAYSVSVYEGQNQGGSLSQPYFFLHNSIEPRMDSIAGFPAATAWRKTIEFDYLIVPANKIVQVVGRFDAAVAANSLDCWLLGYTIPRGNITF